MSGITQSLQLEIISPDNEPKLIKQACVPDLESVVAAVKKAREELLSHIKKSARTKIGETFKDDENEDEDEADEPTIEEKRKKIQS